MLFNGLKTTLLALTLLSANATADWRAYPPAYPEYPVPYMEPRLNGYQYQSNQDDGKICPPVDPCAMVKDKLVNSQQSVLDMKDKMAVLIQEKQQLEEEISKKFADLQHKQQQIGALTADSEEKQKHIVDTQQQLDKHTAAKDKFLSDIGTLTADNQQLHEQLAEANKKASGFTQQQAGLETKLMEQQQALSSTKASLVTSEQLQGELKNKLAELESELAGNQENIKTLEADLDSRPTVDMVDDLKNQIAKLTEEKGGLQAELNKNISLQQKISSLQADVARLSEQNGQIKGELTTALKAGQACNNDLSGLKSSLKNAEKSSQALHQKLKTSQETCETKVAGLNADLANSRSQVGDDDQDGVLNITDQCPATSKGEPVNSRGCPPDGDNDGVADRGDLCPATPVGTSVDEMGCTPNVPITLEGVYFVTDSAELRPESTETLGRVVNTMTDHKNLKVEIAGHTDSIGDANYNVALSQRRTESVRQYLIDKGINADRLNAKGYGESKPVAANNTREGRAKNRRVELHRMD